jgi:methionyl aminopeptidase
MIHYKSRDEIDLMRKSNQLVAKTLAEAGKNIEVGITTLEIDTIIDSYIRSNNAIPAFKDYNGFPNSACISVNDAVVHGIPNEYSLKDGDIVSVDVGVILNDYFGDSAYTFKVGEVSDEVNDLLEKTKASLYLGLEQASVGRRLGDIGYAIQNYIEVDNHYHIVRDLVGHGIGKNLHEEPEVPNFGRRGNGLKIRDGLVIAIEPMVNMGTSKVKWDKDGWTVLAADGLPSAHFEHTIAVSGKKAEILSSFEWIEAEMSI